MRKVILNTENQGLQNSLPLLKSDINAGELLLVTSKEELPQVIQGGTWDAALITLSTDSPQNLKLISTLQEANPNCSLIALIPKLPSQDISDLTRLGVYDFVDMPMDYARLVKSFSNAFERNDLQTKAHQYDLVMDEKYKMIGASPALQEIKEVISKVAPINENVLITGPNGSGKELIAHAIHSNSSRSKKSMVIVNCAAIPKELMESVMFGHMKGSFTGASENKIGKFEEANGSTLFLDEIGDMPLDLQAKLLRTLQDGTFTPIGEKGQRSTDCRVVAATNKNISLLISEGKFREDLFYRLNTIQINNPSLAERKADIPELIKKFSSEFGSTNKVEPKEFNPVAIKILQDYKWPGNIRELRGSVIRLNILGDKVISPSNVQKYVLEPSALDKTLYTDQYKDEVKIKMNHFVGEVINERGR